VAIDMFRVAISNERIPSGALASGGVIRVMIRITPVLVRGFRGG